MGPDYGIPSSQSQHQFEQSEPTSARLVVSEDEFKRKRDICAIPLLGLLCGMYCCSNLLIFSARLLSASLAMRCRVPTAKPSDHLCQYHGRLGNRCSHLSIHTRKLLHAQQEATNDGTALPGARIASAWWNRCRSACSCSRGIDI